MKELVRGARTMDDVLEEIYLDSEEDEMSNIEALRMIVYSQEDWDIRIRLFEPLRAKALLDSLAEKKFYTCKRGPLYKRDRRDNDNSEFFTHSGRFVWPKNARVLSREINILSDDIIYTVLAYGERKTIVLQ